MTSNINSILNSIKNGKLTAREGMMQIKELKQKKMETQSISNKIQTAVKFYEPVWQTEEAETERNGQVDRVLLFHNTKEITADLFHNLDVKAADIAHKAEDYMNLFSQLEAEGFEPDTFCYVLSEENGREKEDSIDTFFHFIKSCKKVVKRIVFLHYGENSLSGLFYQACSGYMKSLKFIWPDLEMVHIAIIDEMKDIDRICSILQKELSCRFKSTASEIQYRNGIRYVQKFKECQLSENGNICREGGTYLITGGAGGLGKLIGADLAKNSLAHVILCGRRENVDISALDVGLGSIEYRQADVSNKEQMTELIKSIKLDYGKINGVIHAAGKSPAADIMNKSIEEFNNTLLPKIDGTLILHEVTKEEPLDFFILFSSISSVLGDFGQCDYSIGNTFLNKFAAYRNGLVLEKKCCGKTISINWPLWKDGGMHGKEGAEQLYFSTSGLESITNEDGVDAFYKVLKSEMENVIILAGDEKKYKNRINIGFQENSELTKKEIENRLLEDIKDMMSELLQLDKNRIDATEQIAVYGFDSIDLKQLAERISRTFQIEITPTVFFSYTRLTDLIRHIQEQYNDKIISYYGEKTNIVEKTKEAKPVFIKKEIQKQKSSERKKIAVIGMSGVFPECDNPGELWDKLVAGMDLVKEIPIDRWDYDRYYSSQTSENKSSSKWGGFIHDVDKFDNQFFHISPREAELMDPQQRIYIQTVWNAFEDAGYRISDFSGKKVGVFTGIEFSDYQSMLTMSGITAPQVAPGNAHSMMSNRISYLYNFTGPSEAIDTACSSSLVALKRAVDSMILGESETAVAGGISLNLTPYNYIAASQMGMLSKDGRCKSFDKEANGFVKSEGIGAVILKDYDQAVKDHDNIYGVIIGSSENHGGKASSLTAPNMPAQKELLIDAYRKADIDIETVSYIETHGTGTELGDPIEVDALKEAFACLDTRKEQERKKHYCGLGSVKSNVGHLEAASGIIGVIKVLLSMKNKMLPKVLMKELNPYLKIQNSPFYIVTDTAYWETMKDNEGKEIPRRAGVSSFGFGGTNAHIVFEEYQPEEKRELEKKETEQVFLLSARNKKALLDYVKNMSLFLSKPQTKIDFHDFIYTMQIGRESMEARLAFMASDLEELKNKLNQFVLTENLCDGMFINVISKSVCKNPVVVVNGSEVCSKSMFELEKLWLEGAEIDWKEQWKGKNCKRISLPTYPFQKQSHWVKEFYGLVNHMFSDEAKPESVSEEKTGKEQINKESVPEEIISVESGIQELLAVQDWKEIKISNSVGIRLEGTYLLLVEENLPNQIIEQIKTISTVTWILFTLPAQNSESGKEAGENLIRQYGKIDGLLDFSDFYMDNHNEVELNQAKISLFQVLIKQYKNKGFHLFHFTNRLQAFGVDNCNLNGVLTSGLVRMLSYEYKEVNSQTIDLDYKGEENVVSDIFLSLKYSENSQLCIRNGVVYEPCFYDMRLYQSRENSLQLEKVDISSNGVYVIAGGTSGIGLELAKHLVQKGAKNLVLMGIRPIPDKNLWNEIEDSDYEQGIKDKVIGLRTLEEKGVTVEIYTGALTEASRLEKYFEQIRRTHGAIKGVIQCAWKSFEEAPYFIHKSTEDIAKVLEPKVMGTLILSKIFEKDNLQFFVMSSSIASAVASMGAGNCHYSMANYFLDCFANYKNQSGHKEYKTINWIFWGEAGFATDQSNAKRLSKIGIYPMTNQEGIQCFDTVLQYRKPHFMAGRLDKYLYDDIYISSENFLEDFLYQEVEVYHQSRKQEFDELKEIQVLLNEYIGLQILKYFQDSGVFTVNGQRNTLQQIENRLNIIPKYKRMLHAMLHILERRGYIKWYDKEILEYCANNGVCLDKRIESLTEKLLRDGKEYKDIFHTLSVCFPEYHNILTGKVKATDIIFPQGSMKLVEGIYSKGKVIEHLNIVMQKYILALVKDKLKINQHQNVKILEIGSGTGGTTKYIVDYLKEYNGQVEYYYTDISRAFLLFGQENFKECSFMHYQLLNIENDVLAQGFEKHGFDIVFGTNVIHATKNIHTTLSNVKELLKENGIFMLNEMMSVQDFATCIFGLLDDWWSYDDEEVRLPDAPLLSKESWRKEFNLAGLHKHCFFGVPNGYDDGIAQAVLGAASNESIDRIEEYKETSEESGKKVANSSMESITSGSVVEKEVKRIFSEILKIPSEEIKVDVSLDDYGVDSILTGSIVSKLEAFFGFSINPSIIFENDTIHEIADYLEKNHKEDLEKMKMDADEKTEEIKESVPFKEKTAVLEAKTKKVAVIGMACHFPRAENKEQFWSNIEHGVCSIREVPESRWDVNKFYSPRQEKGKTIGKWGGFIEDIEFFDPEYFKFKKEDAVHIDPLSRQFLEVSAQAVRDAGYEAEEMEHKKCGVFAAARVSNYTDMVGDFQKNSIIGLGQNFTATHVSRVFNLNGPTVVVDTACSSSLVSIHLACQSILSGETEMAFAGGTEILLNQRPYLILSAMGAFSPNGVCYPFDQRANGFVPGEGCGVVLLKDYDKAIADGDRIYAVIDGTAVNNDGRTMGITTPNPHMQKQVILDAWQKNNIDGKTVSYIEAHGTGTPIGDPIELKGLTEVFREYTEETGFCCVGSVKPNIGHLFLAAGVASFIKTVMCIQHKTLVPLIHCETPNPRFNFEGSPLYINRESKKWEQICGIRRAGISSFGLGGTNAHIVVSELEENNKIYHPVRKPLPEIIFHKERYWPENCRKIEHNSENNFMLKLTKK